MPIIKSQLSLDQPYFHFAKYKIKMQGEQEELKQKATDECKMIQTLQIVVQSFKGNDISAEDVFNSINYFTKMCPPCRNVIHANLSLLKFLIDTDNGHQKQTILKQLEVYQDISYKCCRVNRLEQLDALTTAKKIVAQQEQKEKENLQGEEKQEPKEEERR